jgi:hypothetical protein
VLGLLSLKGPFSAIADVTTAYTLLLGAINVVVVGALLFFINKAVKAVRLHKISVKTGWYSNAQALFFEYECLGICSF